MIYKNDNGILLRKVDHDDLELLFAYKQESWNSTHRISILNRQDQDSWFRRINESPNILVLRADYGNDVIQVSVGVYILDPIDWTNGCYSMSYGVFKSERSKGFGKKLVQAGLDFGFDILNLRRAECEVLANNTASIKCVEHAGFVKEGIKRKAIRRLGEEIDSIVYGCLR